jgi:uncharacterized membrane protein YfcA
VKEIILFLVGIIVGGMNSIAGGGMLLGFPVMLAAGMSPLTANVTGNLVILPGQLTSAFGYREFLKRTPKRYLLLLIPCVIGAAIGAEILRHTSSSQFGKLVPGLILFAVLLFAFQPFISLQLHRHMKKRSKRIKPLILIALALFPVTIYAGYFGAGFGFIMLAFLSFTKLHDVHKMNALKNLAGATIATVSLVVLFSTHLFNWPLGIAMALGNGVGGYAGSRLSVRWSTHAIRIIVIAIGFTATAYLALRAY